MVDSVGAFLASLDAGVFPLASWGWLPAGEVLGSSVGRSAWPPEEGAAPEPPRLLLCLGPTALFSFLLVLTPRGAFGQI